MSAEHLTRSEVEKIEQELQESLNILIIGCEKFDMELAFSVFADSDDFLMMGTDGSICDYQTYLKNNIDYLMACSSFKLTTLQLEIRILRHDVAVLSWAYKADATFRTGEREVFDGAGASFVFNKINNEWKVIYYHESSLPPTREKGK